MHKGRGKLFREVMERQCLYAASGHYHGTHGNSSTIDFVILPQSHAESIHAATVLERSGRQLQHARVRRPLDHDPVMIRSEHAPEFFRPANRERPPLDMDLLCLAMTTGYRRAEFLAQVELETEAPLRRHPPHATMTDHKWQDVVAILQRAAAEFYAKGPLKEQMDGDKEFIQVRENILSDRGRVRNRPAKVGTDCVDSLEERRAAERVQDRLVWKLKELTRLAKEARRRWSKHKKAALEMQLVEAEKAGRLATVYRLSRLLSGNCGLKRRQHRSVKRHQTAEQWEKELSAPGHQGGMGAVACSFADEWAKCTSTATLEEKGEPDANAFEEAERLVRTLAKRFATCDKRRAAPPWSVPNPGPAP